MSEEASTMDPDFLEMRGSPCARRAQLALKYTRLPQISRAHPAVPLFGQTPQEHCRIWQCINESANYHRDLFDVDIDRPLLHGHSKDDPEGMRASAARA